MTEQTIRLPWPPTVNSYWRHVGHKVLLSAKGRDYRHDVAAEVIAAGAKPMTGRLGVFVEAFPKDRRRFDVDNLCKGLLDSCQHAGLYADDSQIDDLRIVRRDPTGLAAGYVLVTLRRLDA